MRNVADLIRDKSHLRDPAAVDYVVNKAYESLLEAENHHVQHTLIFQFLAP